MSSGDTPPVRFTSPSSASSSTKKYPGTPKSPMMNHSNNNNSNNSNTGNRNSQARQRLLASKISAPRPINLPSLRREHAAGSDVPASSPASSHGWGSASSSPSLAQQSLQHHDDNEQASEKKHDLDTADKTNKSPDTTAIKSPVLIPANVATSPSSNTNTATTRAWAIPTITQTKAPPSIDFPTAAEAASGTNKKQSLIDDKEYLKYASSDPNHRSWDEMVSEDLDDFSVDVVEFDDGTKVLVESDTSSTGSQTPVVPHTDPVLPSERFTDDYDRSYPPKQPYYHQQHHQNQQQHHQYNQYHDSDYNHKPFRRSEDHGYSSRYNNNSNYNNRRHSTEGGNERRISSTSGSNDRWGTSSSSSSARRESMEQAHYGNRRSSYDRKHDTNYYHPTSLLQRPRRLSEQSFRSDHSREDNALHIIPEPNAATTNTGISGMSATTGTESPAEITVVQKTLMLTAAERAKKRLEEQEAEFKAAAERARKKAAELAAKQAELKEKDIPNKTLTTDPETTTRAEKKISSSSFAPATPSKANGSPSSPTKKPLASQQPTTTTPPPSTAKAPLLPPKVIDTSKPWNLVAANKQVPTISALSVAAKNEPKASPIESSNEIPCTSQMLIKEKKPVTIMKKEPKVTPIQESVNKKEEAEKGSLGKAMTEDEKKWQTFVSTIKTDQSVATKQEITSNDWNSYADRLQETTAEKDAIAALKKEKLIKEVEEEIQREQQQQQQQEQQQQQQQQQEQQQPQQQQQPQVVEVMDYENEEWGTVPISLMHGRGGWIRDENTYNQQRNNRSGHRGGGRDNKTRDTVISTTHIGRVGNSRSRTSSSTDYWRHEQEQENEMQQKPIVVEILKKNEPEKKILSKKTRLSNLLKEASSPIFPDFIDKLTTKKPANMSFMVDTEESDKEITMMGQQVEEIVEEEGASVATSTTTSASTTTTTSTTTSNDNNNEASALHTTLQFVDQPTPLPSQPPPQPQQHLPPQQQQQQRKMNVNRHFPVLVYQYPSQSSSVTTSNKPSFAAAVTTTTSSSTIPQNLAPSSQHQQTHRPMGVYLMPQQPYLASNQYVVPYPQAGTGNVQPIYFPTLSWQQANSSPRPSYEQQQHCRLFNNDYSSSTATTSSNGFKHYKYPNNTGVYQSAGNGRASSSYRKRNTTGGSTQSWSGLMAGSVRGRGTGKHTGSSGRGGYQQQSSNYHGYSNSNRRYSHNKTSSSSDLNSATTNEPSTASSFLSSVAVPESSSSTAI